MSNVRICRKSVPKNCFLNCSRSRVSGIAAVIAGCSYIFQLFLLPSGKAGISAVFAGCGCSCFQLFL
jgi:hypothetical protein